MKYLAIIILTIMLSGCQPASFSCQWDAGELLSDMSNSYWTVVLDVLDLDCD